MPARFSIVIIVLFWLAATTWLVYREFMPEQRAGDPPPVRIDLPDEAGRHVVWSAYRGERRICTLDTWVEYLRKDDTYKLHSYFHPQESVGRDGFLLPKLKGMDSMYRITREGELREIESTLTLQVPLEEDKHSEIKAVVKGRVENGSLVPRWQIDIPSELQSLLGLKLPESGLSLETAAVAVPQRGGILNPLQPVNALRGVHEGQTWEMPLFDPIGDSLSAYLGKKAAVPFVRAEVKAAGEPLLWNESPETCLIIDYEGKDFAARTWVRASDGKVLQHETTLQGDHLVLKRNRD